MDDMLGLQRFLIYSLILTLLVLAAFTLIGGYIVRRLEVGANPARQEIKIAAVLLVVILPLFLIVTLVFAFTFYKAPRGDTILTIIALLTLIVVIGAPLYWWFRTSDARKSELFQISVKPSKLLLFPIILALLTGVLRLLLSDLELYDILMALGQILLGLFMGAMWVRPAWHITKEGIFWHWAFIKWEKVTDHEWQPLDEKKVLLRLKIKAWYVFGGQLNQPIPIAFERPLKAIIQKYTSGEATPWSSNMLT